MPQPKTLQKPTRKLPRRAFWLLLLPLSAALSLLARAFPAIAEQVFALGLYKWASQAVSRLTGLLPFSLMELCIIALIVILIVFLILFIREVVKKKGKRSLFAGHTLLNLACFFSAGCFIFTVFCGVNYYRYPFSYYSGLTLQPSSAQELDDLCTTLAGRANLLREQLPVDENGVAKVFTGGFRPVSEAARSTMGGLGQKYQALAGYYPPVKPVLFSNFMSRTQITGVYCPFTMEANINTACTEYTIPATMCHELSHMRGFMREDEANFIAYLACAQSENAAFRYSGTMLALVHAGNQLYNADRARFYALQQSYSESVARDMDADYLYWKQFEDTVISAVSNTVNDTYLKANRQADGVKSYGRMVDLLLALQRSGNLQRF